MVVRRARAGRSPTQVALDAGISPETLRKIESGRIATPAFATLALIADALGLSLDAIWREIEGVHDDDLDSLTDALGRRVS